MILTCPSCATRWTVNAADLATPGRMVRCSSCGHTWLPDAAEEIPALPPLVSAAPESAPATPRPRAGQPDDAAVVRPPPAGSAIDDDFDTFLNAPIAAKAEAEADLPPMDFLAAMADAAADAKTAPASTDSIIAKSLFAMDDEDDPAPKPAKGRTRPLPPADEMVGADALRDRLKPAGAAAEFGDLTPPPLDPPIARRPARPARPPAAKRGGGSPLGWALLVLIFSGTAAGLYFGRTQIVEAWPPAAVAYARAGLPVGFAGEGFDLADVSSTRRDDVGLLVIEGRVLNTTGSAKPAPRLKAIVSGADDRVLKEWTFAGPALPPNAAEPFKVELKDLPQAADKLVVTFTE